MTAFLVGGVFFFSKYKFGKPSGRSLLNAVGSRFTGWLYPGVYSHEIPQFRWCFRFVMEIFMRSGKSVWGEG